jgi:inorganic pyrophosphatase
MQPNDEALHDLLAKFFQAHPSHGVAAGADAPALVNAYIEIVPTDAMKYELDKSLGHRVDRAQRFSSMCPAPYLFIPQTFCSVSVAALCESRTGAKTSAILIRSISVATERPAVKSIQDEQEVSSQDLY